MIDGLISGTLHSKPAEKTGPSKKPFVITKVRATSGGENFYISVISFSATVCKTLLSLDAGDAVCLTGPIVPKTWTDARDGTIKAGLDMVANVAQTIYSTRRKRAAIAQADEPAPAAPGTQMPHDEIP